MLYDDDEELFIELEDKIVELLDRFRARGLSHSDIIDAMKMRLEALIEGGPYDV